MIMSHLSMMSIHIYRPLCTGDDNVSSIYDVCGWRNIFHFDSVMCSALHNEFVRR